MSRRVAVLIWLALSFALWNGVFDLYVSRGAREYLQRQAEFELQRGPEPSMAVVMTNAKHDGAIAASLWALTIVAAGLATTFAVKKR